MMAFAVVISEAAENDVREAYLWYEDQLPSLGEKFEAHFTEAVTRISNAPLETQIRYGATRVFFLWKFPYGIHFVIREETIIIAAVFHTAMDSKRWRTRS